MEVTEAAQYELPLRVYIEDTDAGGIVYYINYLKFMERARTELLRSLGFAKTAILSEDLMFVVHSAQIQYHRPATLDQLIHVSASIATARRTSLLFRQSITRGQDLLCSADVKVACVNRADLRPCAMPAAVQAAVSNFISLKKESTEIT